MNIYTVDKCVIPRVLEIETECKHKIAVILYVYHLKGYRTLLGFPLPILCLYRGPFHGSVLLCLPQGALQSM